MASAAASRVAPPLEHRILLTATLCLLAFGAVMVYSASSPSDLLQYQGNGTAEFVRYLSFGAIGLVAMHVLARRGMTLLSRRFVNLLLLGSFLLLVLVLVPGVGKSVLGARRWFAAGPIQFQPSELMKLAIVLYAARYLADHPAGRLGQRPGSRMTRPAPGRGSPEGERAATPRDAGGMHGSRRALAPVAVLTVPACLLIIVEPDLGTALVLALTIAMLLLAAGVPVRYLVALGVCAVAIMTLLVLAQPYQRARLTSFLHPFASATKAGAGYQAVQGQIALGSGGLLGVGLGRSVQKIFYLPEAQTDFILAVVGEELGVLGIFGVVFLYGMIAYAGLRTARRASGRYAKLLAAGLTSLILCQGILNIFVVLGLAPLTGVPLPFVSYAPTNLCIMLAAVGLLLNIARPGRRSLHAVQARGGERPVARGRGHPAVRGDERPAARAALTAADRPGTGAREESADRDRRGRDRRARRAGAGSRGRATR